jgi:hypothetical protein
MSDSPLKQNRIVPIDKLRPHPRNYRQHPEAQVAKLVASLSRFGQGRSIVVQDGPEGLLIVAGHGIVEAAKKLNYTELRADILPADWTSAQVDGYLVADNLHSQDATDDEVLLAEILQEQQDAGFDLASLGTDDEALRQMLEALGDEYLDGGSGDDEGEDDADTEPDEEQTRVRVGDIWKLGRHTIACLDSTDPNVINKLFKNTMAHMIFADPPYGVKERTMRKSAGRGKLAECNDFPSVIGDDKAFDPAFILRYPCSVRILWGANYFADRLPVTSSWVVWDKREGIPSNDNADCELAWTDAGGPARLFAHRWNGMIKASEQGEKRVHPTQKPVKLAEFCFDLYGKAQDVIFDPFLGSGISVIAAERMPGNRTVIGCELSPDYIDVVIRRWEKETGRTAELLERVEGS